MNLYWPHIHFSNDWSLFVLDKRKVASLVMAVTVTTTAASTVATAAEPNPISPTNNAEAKSVANDQTHQVSQAELDAAKLEMEQAFKDRDAVSATLQPGESKLIGEYRGYGAYVTRTTDGQTTVALGDPNARERGVCHFAVSAALVAIGVAAVAGLIAVAPEGAAFITVAGYEIPMSVAEAFVAAGNVTNAIDGLIALYIC